MIDNWGYYLIQQKIMFSRLTPFSDSIRVSLPIDISSEPEDGFLKFKQCLEAEKTTSVDLV